MPYLQVEGFSGIMPRLSSTLLPPVAAQIAKDIRLESGEIKPWRGEVFEVDAQQVDPITIYKYQGPAGTQPVWMQWAYDVDVVPGPVADLEEGRLYMTSANFPPRKTNWALATGQGSNVPPFPNAFYEMGTPAPLTAPIAVAAGTGAPPVETRAYVYTYVTMFGTVKEESAPSPATIVTANYSGDAVTVSGFAPPPTGQYNFQYIRIYRTVTGTSTSNYQLVAEIPYTQASYVDTVTVQQLGQILPSLNSTPPPEKLQGLIAMPNGMLAGFVGNQVWFCEPYMPHAWPVGYMQTTEYPIVGLGVFGNSLFVATEKHPYVISGMSPVGMASVKLPILQPCASKRSIVSDHFGVVYASPSGLVAVSTGRQEIVTSQMFLREQWQELRPETMTSVMYNGMYMGFYNNAAGRGGIVMHRGDSPALVSFSYPAQALFIEQTTGSLFAVHADTKKTFKLDANSNALLPYTWRSKEFVLPNPLTFAVVQVLASYQEMLTLGRTVTINVYADGAKVHSFTPESFDPTRMPAGFKAHKWVIEFVGTITVQKIVMATNALELKEV
jgi:hypothetical protein